MKLLIFSKYFTKGASSRYRTFQYLPFLEENDIEISINSLYTNEYLNFLYSNGYRNFTHIIISFLKRMFVLFKLLLLRNFDVVLIEKELFPYFPSIFERLLKLFKINYILDYDDAIFHNYDLHPNYFIRFLLSNKIKNIVLRASSVIVGNSYLFNYCVKHNNSVTIIPTVVDTNKFGPRQINLSKNSFIIGWIGSMSTSKYLIPLIQVFKRLSSEMEIEFKFIGFDKNLKDLFFTLPIQFLDWDESSEIQSLQIFSVGIMPLNDSPWARGKCGFKLIQYMACGIPVVASPVGVNTEIVKDGVNGLLATSDDEWYSSIKRLYDDSILCKKMGKHNINKIKQYYSLNSSKKKYLNTIKSSC